MEIKSIKELKNKRIHFIGIGGISMSALAQMLRKEKIYVQGSDESENEEVLRLKRKGIKIFLGHNNQNLKGVDVVIYSSAISSDNEEFIYAKEKGLVIIKRAELLGIVASGYENVISIAGSHGKSTTAAMISEIFINAGLKPTIHLGAVLKKTNSNMVIGNKKYFITESCEYKDNFLFLKPDVSVILNIDADHLDYFGDLEGVKRSFYRFSKNTKIGGINIVCGDDVNSTQIKKSANCIKFGMKSSDIYAKKTKYLKNGCSSFDVFFHKIKLGNIVLNLIGEHNVCNALAAVAVGILCNIDFEIIKMSIESFCGTKRRCDYICDYFGAKVYHDYAHHPKQIEKMVSAFKNIIQNEGKLVVVFEPHTYSRTKYLLDEFVDSFSFADKIILAPVYSARERKEQGVSSNELYDELKNKNKDVELFDSFEKIKSRLKNVVCKGDILLVLGAGTIERLAKMLKG